MTATDPPRRVSRRRAIRLGGAALAAGLAGCSGLPPLGSEIRYGSVDVPAPRDPTYRSWLPAPAAFPDGSEPSGGYSVMVHAPPPADAPAWSRPSPPRAIIASMTDYVGVDIDDVAVAASLGSGDANGAVLVGDVDPSAVRAVVADLPYRADGSRAGFDLYVRTDRDRVLAAGPDGLAFANGPSARGIVRAAVDARRGEAPRYHERDENVATLTDSAGLRRWGWLWMGGVAGTSNGGMVEDTVGWASGFDHRNGEAYVVETWVFPPAYDLTEGRVKRALKGGSPAVGLPDRTDAGAADVTVEGRVATIAMVLSRSFVREELADQTFLSPYVTWRATFDPDAQRVTFHHEAGDPVRSAGLYVRGGGLRVSAASAGDVGEQIEPGESFTVSTADYETETGDDAENEVTLVVESPDGEQSATVFSHELP